MSKPRSLSEVKEVVSLTWTGKAAGLDGIPAEFIKDEGPSLHAGLHRLFLLDWEAESVPSDFATIFKKGDSARTTASYLYSPWQQRSPAGSSSWQRISYQSFKPDSDQNQATRQLWEKACEQNQALYMIFYDLEKAFDYVP